MLFASYLGAAFIAVRFPTLFRAPVMVTGHLLFAAALTVQAVSLDRASYTPAAIQAFYRFIWSLFYSEYFLWIFC